VWLDDDGTQKLTWELDLGHLDPIDTVRGVKARLANLGFDPGEINDTWDDAAKEALTQFQVVYGLPTTGGEVDDATRKKLREVHENER